MELAIAAVAVPVLAGTAAWGGTRLAMWQAERRASRRRRADILRKYAPPAPRGGDGCAYPPPPLEEWRA